MSLTAPFWLLGAGAVAVATVLLHLLARRRPRRLVFPTARFIPDRPASAPALARRPSDPLLLLFRVLVVLLLGLALARPYRAPGRHTTIIAAVDRSRVAPRSLDDSTRRLLRGADLVLRFDSAAASWDPAAADPPSSARGSLSSALVAALRAAARLRDRGDSIELVVVSPFAEEEWDAATMAIRRAWHGAIRPLPVAPAAPPEPRDGRATLDEDDPLGATLSLIGREAYSFARLVRYAPSAVDSGWARAGGALVYWPRVLGGTGWEASRRDTVAGVMAGGFTVVTPFIRAAGPPSGVVVARWADGTPAATERPLGAGCERDVAIPTRFPGDAPLRSNLRGLVRALMAPCGGPRDYRRVSAARLDSLRGGSALLAASEAPRPPERRVPASGGLLLAALLLYAAEPVARRLGR